MKYPTSDVYPEFYTKNAPHSYQPNHGMFVRHAYAVSVCKYATRMRFVSMQIRRELDLKT